MDAEKYSRSVTLQCPTCGGTDFKHDNEDDSGPVTCTSCNRITSREELMNENGANIEASLDEMKKEVVKDMRAEFSTVLKKAVGNSKFIKIK